MLCKRYHTSALPHGDYFVELDHGVDRSNDDSAKY